VDSDALDLLWRHVTNNWQDGKSHIAFVEQATEQGRLLEAATRYREVSGDPQRADEANRRMKAIATLAMVQLSNSRTSPEEARRRAWALVLLLLLATLTIAALLAYALRR
jgi:hypothetical protein